MLDEQQKQQYEMMKFMTIFIGLMFYKVAAGLCLYFIVSAVWGLTERQLLPKYDPSKTDTGPDKPRKPGLFERVMREARARQQAATEPALGQTAQPQQPAPSQQSQGGQGGRKSARTAAAVAAARSRRAPRSRAPVRRPTATAGRRRCCKR